MLTNLCIWNDFKSTISLAYINITYSNLAKFLKIFYTIYQYHYYGYHSYNTFYSSSNH